MSGLDGPHIIELTKVTDYLLSATHPIGRAKAAFFTGFGFDPDDPQRLMDALEQHARMRPVTLTDAGPFGTKRVVRCTLISPDGRNPCILAVWLQPRGSASHRLITAYPAPV